MLGPSSSMLPIQITNVLPGPTSAEAETVQRAEVGLVEFHGARDESLQDYCNWQQSQVQNPEWKAGFQKTTDFLVGRCTDLELLFEEEQNPEPLVNEAGIQIGIARRHY